MEPVNMEKSPKTFSYFEVAFITVALLIGAIIHELDFSSILKTLIVLVIIAIMLFLEKVNFWGKWRFTKVGKINLYVFWIYVFIAFLVMSFLTISK